MTDRPVRLGVVGCGVIGEHHVAEGIASERIEVVAAADVRSEAAEALTRRFELPAWYDHADAMFEDPRVEAVVLAVPAAGRAELAQAALAGGKHVMLEKPPALHARELSQLAAAIPDGLICACASARFRNSPATRAAADFLRSGQLGRIRAMRLLGTHSAPPRPHQPPPFWRLSRAINGGGILANWGSYDLDVLLGVTEWKLVPHRVFSMMHGVPPSLASHVAPGTDGEISATVCVTCRDGESILLQRTEYAPLAPEDDICIIGDLGSLRWRLLPGEDKAVVHTALDDEEGVASEAIWRGDDIYDIHRLLLEDFATAIRERRPPMTTLAQALSIQSVLDAAYASADEGCAVAVLHDFPG